MKKYINTFLFCSCLSLLTAGLSSCEKYLEREPATEVNPEDAYKTFGNFQGFTEELYHCITDFAKEDYNNYFNLGEEEHYSTTERAASLTARVDRGDYWSFWGFWFYRGSFDTNGGDRNQHPTWNLAWYGIRKANMGLENLHKMTGTDEQRDLIEGQLLFFRAWFHFELIQYVGGLPYIDRVLPADEKLTLPRLSYQECADKIAIDFQRAAELLPVNWDDTETGSEYRGLNQLRINKIMALCFLGKNYLWAGSPLMNGESTGSRTYNAEYCKKAADVLGTVLEMVENGETQYSLVDFKDYLSLCFTNGMRGIMPGLTEAIFRGPSYRGTGGTDWSVNKQYLCSGVLQDRSGSLYPTANYANYFGMANGLPINESNSSSEADDESGYDPFYPWKNRDPRFYLTFAFDTKQMVLGGSGDAEKYRYANLYTFGGDLLTDPATYRLTDKGSTTGYLLIKFNPIGFNKFDNYYNSNHLHISRLRLADVYLMYAEAVANGYGNIRATSTTFGEDAVYAVNVIRERAGVPEIASKYLTSLDQFMKELRRERAVELAFEGHRFTDLRRWRLLTEYPYTLKTSIEFDRAEPVNFDKQRPENNRVLNLRDVVLEERPYTEKHYWLPLRTVDVNMYLEFAQNPGW